MEKLTIVRKQWLRGDSQKSMLRNADGKMCCLGFLCLSRGYTPTELLDVPDPLTLTEDRAYCEAEDFPKLAGLVKSTDFSIAMKHSLAATVLMDVNDDKKLDEYTREQRVAATMKAELNVEVEFV